MLCHAERKFYNSKARISWARDGDISTKYFHSCMRKHQIRSRILTVQNREGIMVYEQDEIKKVATNFYKELFTEPQVDRLIENGKINQAIKVPLRKVIKWLCIYKIISSILAARLKSVLHTVIGLQQTTYVPGRKITNGILIMQELMVGYDKEARTPRCAIKVDIVKAYDTFKGIEAGDPLSPYLFIMIMKVFNVLLLINIDKYGFDYHPYCKEMRLTNVCFVDDLFLITGATSESFHVTKNTLIEFDGLVGLFPNLDKSCCFFVVVSDADIECLERIMKIPVGKLHVKYLGVSLTTQISAADCRLLVDQINSRIEPWSHKHVSYAGRITLINSVLFGISNY
ncbi:hypothetical protein LIER_40771 [Lithospermum erythrorhizon]|uniref:Reverse transcriptase domain-containing protein n=1 Tax=Lithospermum erythrorhizon TaxID=34254 RepID=A0AAV3QZL7_LITER